MGGRDEVFVLTIHTTETINPDLDVAPILDILGPDFVASLTWGIGQIELGYTGPEAHDVYRAVDDSPDGRILMSGKDLLQIAPKFMQVIDGDFVGYSSESDATEFLEGDWYSVAFRDSLAHVALDVNDGAWFTVYLRDKSLGEQLARSFTDVQWEDPANYLA